MMKLLKKIKYKLKYYISDVPQPEKWVFIVGCSNSGTSLLHTILSLHPSIGSLPAEGQFCTNQLPLNRNIGLKRLWAIPPDKMYVDERGDKNIDVVKLQKQWAVRYNDVKKPILLEKSPTNTVRLRWLQHNFPNAYFIGIHRNGFAVAEGIKRKAGHDVALGAKQWQNANTILFTDFAKLAHKTIISYEDLTEHTEQTVNALCDFLEIPYLNKRELNKAFHIHGRTLNITNMNGESFQKLSKEECMVIRQEAADMLNQLGYSNPSTL